MSCSDCDEILTLNPIPGPAGNPGSPGTPSTVAGPAGVNAFTTLTSPFTQPAVSATVDVAVASSAWAGVGQALFIEVGGYYSVASILSSTSLRLTRLDVPGFAATAATVASGGKVSPGGFSYVDNAQYVGLEDRVTALESITPGVAVTTYSQSTAPTGTIATGSLWFDTDDNYKMYRYDGSGWVEVVFTVTVPDFGTGLKPVSIRSSLPVGDPDDLRLILLDTDWKLYRWTGSVWSAAVAAGDIAGTLPSGAFAANTIAAGVLQAGAVLASNIGSNTVITVAANIGNAVINNAHVADLSVSKLTAGTIDSQIVQISGATGALRSSNYSAGATGFNITGEGVAEFNSVTIRGTLEASKIRNDSTIYAAGSPANGMAATTWMKSRADNSGSGYSTLGASLPGTVVWMNTFYGWTHAGGTAATRFGKATTVFECSSNGGCNPASGSYIEFDLVFRVNGGTTYSINNFSLRCEYGTGGNLNLADSIQISGLGGGDYVEFGFRARSPNNASIVNVVDLSTKANNF